MRACTSSTAAPRWSSAAASATKRSEPRPQLLAVRSPIVGCLHALSASAVLILALTNAACGGDEPSVAPDAGPPLVEEQGCKPGETELEDGTCRSAGVPPEACAPGFS